MSILIGFLLLHKQLSQIVNGVTAVIFFFPFTLTDNGVYANTEPMKIIVPLNVKEKNFYLSTGKKTMYIFCVPKLHDKQSSLNSPI